jgi:hypothetical protein
MIEWQDRSLWIYAAISTFFGILGILSTCNSMASLVVLVLVLWLASIVCFSLSVYFGSKTRFPNSTICTHDNKNCNSEGWISWLVINLLFVVLLVIQTSFMYELGSKTIWSYLSGILALLGGIYLLQTNLQFEFFALVYTAIWLILISYPLVGWG